MGLPFDATGRHAGHNLTVKEDEHDQRRDRDQKHVHEQQIELRQELALEVIERQLNGDVFLARQVIQRVGEIVENGNRSLAQQNANSGAAGLAGWVYLSGCRT